MRVPALRAAMDRPQAADPRGSLCAARLLYELCDRLVSVDSVDSVDSVSRVQCSRVHAKSVLIFVCEVDALHRRTNRQPNSVYLRCFVAPCESR